MSDPISTERRTAANTVDTSEVVDKLDIREVPEWEEPPQETFEQRA